MRFRIESPTKIEQVFGDSTDTWLKLFRPLTLRLESLSTVEIGKIEVADVGLAKSDEYSVKRQIRALGRPPNRRGLIIVNKDGEINEHREDVQIVMDCADGWKERPPELRAGNLFFGSLDRYADLCLQVPVPDDLFDGIWRRLAAGSEPALTLTINVELFQSKVERAMAEPEHHQTFAMLREDMPVAFINTLWVVSDCSSKHWAGGSEAPKIPKLDEDEAEPTAPAIQEESNLSSIAKSLHHLVYALAAIAILILVRGWR